MYSSVITQEHACPLQPPPIKPKAARLQDLDVGKHGPEVIESTSEMISAHLHAIAWKGLPSANDLVCREP